MKKLTIYDIKRETEETAPYFFDRKTMRFFGQTMRSFSVVRQSDGRIKISAPHLDRFTGKKIGETIRFFNPVTKELERN